MDLEKMEQLTAEIKKLSADEQDHIAGFLLIERMKRNQLVMPVMHQRIDDADPDNWAAWQKTKNQLEDA